MSMKIIDLSHTLHENMTVYPGSEKPVLQKVATIKEDGHNEHCLTYYSHTGTHIDAPAHLLARGKSLDSYDINTFLGRALVINCTGCITIERETIENSLSNNSIPQFLLFFTGWDHHWHNKKYFRGYPILSPEAAILLSQLSLNGVGVDAASFDEPDSKDLINHHILLERELILVENLCNLDLIPSGEVLFSCFPLKINKADGSPVRAVAITSFID